MLGISEDEKVTLGNEKEDWQDIFHWNCQRIILGVPLTEHVYNSRP